MSSCAAKLCMLFLRYEGRRSGFSLPFTFMQLKNHEGSFPRHFGPSWTTSQSVLLRAQEDLHGPSNISTVQFHSPYDLERLRFYAKSITRSLLLSVSYYDEIWSKLGDDNGLVHTEFSTAH